MEGLVGALSHNLEANNYSEGYYVACVAVRRALETAAAVKAAGNKRAKAHKTEGDRRFYY